MKLKILHIINFKLLFKFIIPNIKPIVKHRLLFSNITVFQKLFIQGAGQVVIKPFIIEFRNFENG